MKIRKLNVVLCGALFVGTFGLTQGVTAASAVAAPTAVVAGQAHIGVGPDFRKGYRDGFRDGWQAAEDDCQRPGASHSYGNYSESDYMRGYNQGFSKGFDRGFNEYC
jgi:hypothetical protein